MKYSEQNRDLHATSPEQNTQKQRIIKILFVRAKITGAHSLKSEPEHLNGNIINMFMNTC